VQLVAARVARCECTFERQGTEVTTQYASLAPDAASVAVSLREVRPGSLFGHPGRIPTSGAYQQVRLTDDKGTAVVAAFSGGGSRSTYRGLVTTMQPLDRGTKWIDFEGQRVDLVDADAPPPVRIEPVESTSRAERYLWGRMSGGRHGPHGSPLPPQIEAAIETLVAAGALAHDDPVIDEVVAVLGAFSGQPLKREVRQPWQSLLRSQHRQSRRSCVIPLGVVVPTLSGLTIGFDALVIAHGDVEAHVRTSSERSRGTYGPPAELLGDPRVGWWAADELGNRYLGAPTRWAGRSGEDRGVISFWPSLDDRAETLRLLPTVDAERAVIEVPLPHGGTTG
jgi:hypothetical protein